MKSVWLTSKPASSILTACLRKIHPNFILLSDARSSECRKLRENVKLSLDLYLSRILLTARSDSWTGIKPLLIYIVHIGREGARTSCYLWPQRWRQSPRKDTRGHGWPSSSPCLPFDQHTSRPTAPVVWHLRTNVTWRVHSTKQTRASCFGVTFTVVSSKYIAFDR
jgi:hypothetical protein